MDGLHFGPVAGDLGRSGSPPETEDHLDPGEGHADLTERRHQASLIQLPGLVPAIARVGIDAGRPEATEVVIESLRLGRQLRQSGELPDTHSIHVGLPRRRADPVISRGGFTQGEGQGATVTNSLGECAARRPVIRMGHGR
jgi:hypothetical protein